MFIVTKACSTLCHPAECSPPGSSVQGILQARIPEWVAMPLLQRIFPTQESNPRLLHQRQILVPLNHLLHGILQARILELVAMPLLQGIFPTQGSSSTLLRWEADSLPVNHQGNSTSTQCCSSKRQMVFAAERGHYPNTGAIYLP